jgi:hypothetical protein
VAIVVVVEVVGARGRRAFVVGAGRGALPIEREVHGAVEVIVDAVGARRRDLGIALIVAGP